MKIIQLNCWNFSYFDEMLTFLKHEKPDIINLQEVSFANPRIDPEGKYDYFEILKNELGMDGIFAPWQEVVLNSGIHHKFGNAFLTKLDIVDYGVFFEPSLGNLQIVTENDPAFVTTIKDDKSSYYNCFKTPKNYIWATFKYNGQIIRNLTTHFTVSYGCQETLQIIDQTKSVINFLDNAKPLPTIFTGDLNIHDKSYSISLLKNKLDLVNPGLVNTLNPEIHPLFKNEPDNKGLAVDYIFSTGFTTKSCTCPVITISDHLPVIAELELS
jgi:endonuclease/exonuclease/phosphatase family metal-dependent hydrolase